MGDAHIYSRLTAPSTTRLESLLTQLIRAPCLTYSSGLAAFHALLVQTAPKVVAINAGYHGCHGVLAIHTKLSGLKVVDLLDPASWDAAGLGAGDVVHVETPLNPTGEARNIQQFAELAHARGAWLTVDATLGPPGLQDPFRHGADFVMHSGTKYVGGHSDMLCGILATRNKKAYWGLYTERVFLGSVMGSLEGWLGVRSVRTLELRVRRQSDNATALVRWLDGLLLSKEDSEEARIVTRTVQRVQHASLQKDEMAWLAQQMPDGYGPVFAISMRTPDMARRFPSKLALFHHATSLGGVESLIEWRRMSDATVDGSLLRVSVGVEAWEDLRDDFMSGFRALAAEADGAGKEETVQAGRERISAGKAQEEESLRTIPPVEEEVASQWNSNLNF
ncbi:hypothetical protein LTR04_004212 [Oleoguttula sp. CCFEE 6159]|nr:hypothetical protein LTR04_004212 [Oleoguttula sp. CCFEE 6159]